MNDLLVLIFACASTLITFGLAIFLWQLHLMERNARSGNSDEPTGRLQS